MLDAAPDCWEATRDNIGGEAGRILTITEEYPDEDYPMGSIGSPRKMTNKRDSKLVQPFPDGTEAGNVLYAAQPKVVMKG